MEYQKKIEENRKHINEVYKDGEQSPLTPEQQENFTELSFFPVNELFRFQGPIIPKTNPETVQILTSMGDIRDYILYGIYKFVINEKEYSLTVFKFDETSEYCFVPFKDLTCDKETYSGGRYLNINQDENGMFTVDFNTAYNPYCAYNNRWSCPIPPKENWLEVRIEAGEMNPDFKE